MKNKFTGSHRIFVLVTLPILSILFYSCDYYNFSHPQPVDKENIYEFPNEFRGKWVEASDSFEQQVGFRSNLKQGGTMAMHNHQTFFLQNKNTLIDKSFVEEDSSCYFIAKNYAMLISYEKERVAMGAWPKIGAAGEFIYPRFFNSMKKINYDSLKKPIDTFNNYKFYGDKIYEIDNERFLGKGYRYYFDKDTVVVFKNDTICVDLGQNAFLRRLNENFYVLNIRNSILGEENLWWRLIILETVNEDSFKLWECNSKTGELPYMFYDKPSKSDIFYFDCNWSSSEILQLLHKGYFEISSTVTRDEINKR